MTFMDCGDMFGAWIRNLTRMTSGSYSNENAILMWSRSSNKNEKGYLMAETREKYIERVSKQYSRKELLKYCRMIGITGHRIKTNRELAALLWVLKNEGGGDTK
jgi:hypothetical protein